MKTIEEIAIESELFVVLNGDCTVEDLERFLARIDAERGKEAIGMVVDDFDGWTKVRMFKNQPSGTRLFLSQVPAVPEGWVPVPIEPTQAMSEAALNTFIRTSAHEEEIDVDVIYKSMLAAAQGERK